MTICSATPCTTVIPEVPSPSVWPPGRRGRRTGGKSGKTIAPEKLSRIFEQFFRLDAARATSTGGAGLGLAIAKEIVELHHGTIAAESRDERIVFTPSPPLGDQKSV